MSLDKQRLTAYALGELSGADSREVEMALAADPVAKRYVEEVRAFAQLAGNDLRAEPLPAGRGAEPIAREIARRAAHAAPARRRAWLQAGALALVIVLFSLAVPLRSRFEGSVASLMGGFCSGTVTSTETVTEEESRLSHRTVKEDPRVLEQGIDDLIARAREWRDAGDCRLGLPALGVGDGLSAARTSLEATYFLTTGGLEVNVRVRSAPQPLVHDVGVEEAGRAAGGALFRRITGEQSVTYHLVPANPALSYCTVEVSSDWLLGDAAKKVVRPKLEELARSLAEGMSARAR